MDSKITEEWPEPPSIDMAVDMIHDLSLKLDDMMSQIKAMRKEINDLRKDIYRK